MSDLFTEMKSLL